MTIADEPARAGRGEKEAALLLADKLARSVVDAAAPIRLEVATTESQREAVYRLRYEVVVARGWARPEDLPGGMERDVFDERAIHIIGWDAARLIATARIVLPMEGASLPTERAFEMIVEPRGQVADMGRQIVSAEYTNPQHRLFAALLAKTWLEIRAAGYSLITGDFTASVLRLYRMMGFQVTQLGPPRLFWGEQRFPILVDVSISSSQLIDHWANKGPLQESGT